MLRVARHRDRDPNGYVDYIKRTSILIPMPPALYGSLPLIVKRVLLFEWSMYDHLAEISGEASPKTPLAGGNAPAASAT